MRHVTVELKGEGVAVVTMGRGDNELHPELMEDLLEVLDALEGGGVRALVITSAHPKSWCTGLDLAWLQVHMDQPKEVLGYLDTMNALYRRICLYPKPTIAALGGHTFAGGVFLAAHMDFRLMREDRGWVCLPESDIDIPLLPGMLAICQAVMPPQGFRQMYYTGRKFTGPQAKELGFVDEVHPEDRLLEAAVELACELGRKKTTTYAEMKRRIRAHVVRIMDEEDPAAFLPTLRFPIQSDRSYA